MTSRRRCATAERPMIPEAAPFSPGAARLAQRLLRRPAVARRQGRRHGARRRHAGCRGEGAGAARTTARPGTMPPCRSPSACSWPRASRCRAGCSRPWRSRTAASAATCARPTRRPSPAGTEAKLNLCAPGGKETSRMLKRLLEEMPAAAAGNAPAQAKAPSCRQGAEPGSRAMRRSRRCSARPPASTAASRRRTRATSCSTSPRSGLAYAPGDSFGLYPKNDPALAEAVLAALRVPAEFPRRRQAVPRRADRGLRAGPGARCAVRADRPAGGRRAAPEGQAAGRRRGSRWRCGHARRAGGAGEVRARASRPRSVPGVPGAAAAAPLFHLLLAAGDAGRGAPDRRCRAL